ncbi:proto-oncogene Mas-like [Microcaecilia unicolor]|uniref:Proto-oncogene Mas-like n=1 Tax=Microcaecilia unicolor TaxID=1415580 RepID=A0A6P7X959_9AMPH|nr:proto-oncogene Mas-like [Microcaecilia unicolor]
MEVPSIVSLNTTGQGGFNGTGSGNSTGHLFILMLVLSCPSLLFSLLGMAGNGIVFWFLCLSIKRNKFTVYILNLAMADLTILLSCFVVLLYTLSSPIVVEVSYFITNGLFVMRILFFFGYITSLLLLTAISVERCLSVFFPIWHRCQRPKHQSAIVCALLWMFSFLVTALEGIICTEEDYIYGSQECSAMQIFIAVSYFLVVLPIMVLSSLILIVKIWRISQRHPSSQLYMVIIITVIAFFIFSMPVQILNISWHFQVLSHSVVSYLIVCYISIFCASINSAVNPFIYFLVGKHKKQEVQGLIRGALHRVFKDEEETRNEEEIPNSHVSRGEV